MDVAKSVAGLEATLDFRAEFRVDSAETELRENGVMGHIMPHWCCAYLLRGICIHDKSHSLHLILGLIYAYILAGVGTGRPHRMGPSIQTPDFT